MKAWNECRNILCIRPDNIGDVLMSTPAMAALKETFGAKITLLTSSMARSITPFIPVIDDVIVYDVPWVKLQGESNGDFLTFIEQLKAKNFDAAVIFSVFSQNSLPTAMMAYLAGIPNRLGYCRENPYALLTDWVPDKEPYSYVVHQVTRDLNLVKTIGAKTYNEMLRVPVPEDNKNLLRKLSQEGIDIHKPWTLFHPGVSETKRMYPTYKWIEIGQRICHQYQVVITGTQNESSLASEIQRGIGSNAVSVAGKLEMMEFIQLIALAPLVVSVNTATVHLASAVRTPVIVFYALTNPQHLPWRSRGVVFPFPVEETLQSRNEVLRFVNSPFMTEEQHIATPDEVVDAIVQILERGVLTPIPELLVRENRFTE